MYNIASWYSIYILGCNSMDFVVLSITSCAVRLLCTSYVGCGYVLSVPGTIL